MDDSRSLDGVAHTDRISPGPDQSPCQIHEKDIEKQDADSAEESHDEESVGVGVDDFPDVEPESAPPSGGLTGALGRALSRTSTKSVPLGPPPDGGLQAWITGL